MALMSIHVVDLQVRKLLAFLILWQDGASDEWITILCMHMVRREAVP